MTSEAHMHQFLKKVEEQFQETPSGSLTLETKFKEVAEWGSLVALCIIAMVDENYGKSITGNELLLCDTIEDIYRVVMSK